MRSKLPAGTFLLPKTPASTDYSPEKRVLSPVKRAPAYSFGLKKDFSTANGVPGPGSAPCTLLQEKTRAFSVCFKQ